MIAAELVLIAAGLLLALAAGFRWLDWREKRAIERRRQR